MRHRRVDVRLHRALTHKALFVGDLFYLRVGDVAGHALALLGMPRSPMRILVRLAAVEKRSTAGTVMAGASGADLALFAEHGCAVISRARVAIRLRMRQEN